MRYEIEDISLADDGLKRLDWVRTRMPILRALTRQLGETRPFDGLKIGICLHVEAKTGIWIEALQAGGAQIAITGSPGSTQDEVAAALVDIYGVEVFTKRSESYKDHLRYAAEVLKTEPDLIADNGADLHALLHSEAAFEPLKGHLIGATEETTTGGYRLREDLGTMPFPTIVINDSRAKRIIENRYGVGQSVVDGLMRSTNILVGGKRVIVIGYGYCGGGVARALRGLGAHVTVVERDPLTRLEAHIEGFQTATLDEAILQAEVIITVTGRDGILRREHFEQMRDEVILANAGHFASEMDVAGLRALAESHQQIRSDIEAFRLPNGNTLYLIAQGNLVNLAAGDGNPIEVMDLGLALQTLSLVHLTQYADTMQHEPQNVPGSVERKVAEMALASTGY